MNSAPVPRTQSNAKGVAARPGHEPGYKISRCPSGNTPESWVNVSRQKYSALPKFGIVVCVASLRPKEEGRIAIVTNAGRMAVDAGFIGAIRSCRAAEP